MWVIGSTDIAANLSRQDIAEEQDRSDIRGRRMPKVLVLVGECDIWTSTEPEEEVATINTGTICSKCPDEIEAKPLLATNEMVEIRSFSI